MLREDLLRNFGSLRSSVVDVVEALMEAFPRIAEGLANEVPSSTGTENLFGDKQLNADITAEKTIQSVVTATGKVCKFASEEQPVLQDCTGCAEDADLIAFWDPLDGSSIISANWSVGTIVALVNASMLPIVGKKLGDHLEASLIAIYGPRLVVVVAAEGKTVEFTHNASGGFVQTRSNFALGPRPPTRYFAPANLRAASEHAGYNKLLNRFIKERWTLRYSGGLVPDVYHILHKSDGVYLSPVSEHSPPKLRLLFELAAMAHIIECSSGAATDQEGNRILGLVRLRGDAPTFDHRLSTVLIIEAVLSVASGAPLSPTSNA